MIHVDEEVPEEPPPEPALQPFVGEVVFLYAFDVANITKFFGDWHLGRIYQALSARFHLSDWHRVIDEKLKTLDDLYQLLRTEQSNRWMLTLEGSMALLFVIEVALVVIGLKK